MSKANILSIPILIAIVAVFVGAYCIFHNTQNCFEELFSKYLFLQYFIPIFLIGCFVHEFLHVAGFWIFGRIKLSDIKIGIMWKSLTPYAHCKKVVSARSYRIALLLPFFIMGIVPFVVSLILGIAWLNVYAILFAALAGGDLLVFIVIRKVKGQTLLEDHPTQCGCVVYGE